MNLSKSLLALFSTTLVMAACIPQETDNDADGGAGTGATGASESGGAAGGAAGGGAESGGAAGGGTTNGAGWQQLELLDDPGQTGTHKDVDRITGIDCESTNSCVVVTENIMHSGVIYAADNQQVKSILMTGYVDKPRQLSFLGLSKTRAGMIARANTAGFLFAAASDYGQSESWSRTKMGINDSAEGFAALNDQEALGVASDGTWRYLYSGVLFGADKAPSATTYWTGLWSPQRMPPYPSNFGELKHNDGSICNSNPAGSVIPHPTQVMHMSEDLSLIMYGASSINNGARSNEDPPGVCVSTDRGATFRAVSFPNVTGGYGPLGVYCTDKEHCWAYNGLQYTDDSHYIYFTQNASQGMSMTWTRATLPSNLVTGRTQLRHIFFAPDNTHGWAVGDNDGRPLVLRTSDGGANWTDESAPVQALIGKIRLSSGFALDAQNIWVGGEKGVLLSNGRGGLE